MLVDRARQVRLLLLAQQILDLRADQPGGRAGEVAMEGFRQRLRIGRIGGQAGIAQGVPQLLDRRGATLPLSRRLRSARIEAEALAPGQVRIAEEAPDGREVVGRDGRERAGTVGVRRLEEAVGQRSNQSTLQERMPASFIGSRKPSGTVPRSSPTTRQRRSRDSRATAASACRKG